jgi:hypothetical protein
LENLYTEVDINRVMWYLLWQLCGNRFLCRKDMNLQNMNIRTNKLCRFLRNGMENMWTSNGSSLFSFFLTRYEIHVPVSSSFSEKRVAQNA